MATRYVKSSASGSGDGSSTANAWTLAQAAASGTGAQPGDTVLVCADANYVLTATATVACSGSGAGGKITFLGANASGTVDGTRPTVTSATNSVALLTLNGAVTNLRFEGIQFTHTAATRGSGILGGGAAVASFIEIVNCVFDGCLHAVDGGSRAMTPVTIRGNEIRNCTSDAIVVGAGNVTIDGNDVHDNAGRGYSPGSNTTTATISDNVFANNSYGIYDSQTNRSESYIVTGNLFRNNTNDGIRFDTTGTTSSQIQLVLVNNRFESNGGYGVNFSSAGTQAWNDTRALQNCNNSYYGNGTAARQNLSAGDNDLAPGSDPSTNAAARDYTPTSAGGIQAKAYPQSYPSAITFYPRDVGPGDHAAATGSGGPGDDPNHLDGGLT